MKLTATVNSIVNSYAIVFFSKRMVFGVLLMAVSFFNPAAGISGLAAVLCANACAYVLGVAPRQIEDGYYGFNALLVGLGLGVMYQLNPQYAALLAAASLLTCIITAAASGFLASYNLPFLTIPFVICSWLITLASPYFSGLEASGRSIYWINELYAWGGPFLVDITARAGQWNMPAMCTLYFTSLSAILFQHNVIAGIVIAAGLLSFSRIAFTLSVIEVGAAHMFYRFMGIPAGDVSGSVMGFNFILTAIAIGGFFVVPSPASYLLSVILIPPITVLILAFSALLGAHGLAIYSLPFNIIVMATLYALMLRARPRLPTLVSVQYFSPEENMYRHINATERFTNKLYFQLHPPFWGEWTVLQAHDGSFTHKGDWAKAFDFTILDAELKPYKENGSCAQDYYCYDKPLRAPADGFVAEVVNHVEDNAIGTVNTDQNWGNSIVLRYAEGLYTEMCHLKKGSVKVNKGDFVRKGDIIAHCGNSGRSPEPHLHFQVQATPQIGSKTLDYPLAYYIRNAGGRSDLVTFERPRQGEQIANIVINEPLKNAFDFQLDRKLRFEYTDTSHRAMTVTWEVKVDVYNRRYLYCAATQSYAYFVNDGTMFYFTDFYGDRGSLLFYFYCAFYRVLLGAYEGVTIGDTYPADLLNNKFFKLLQDVAAPFVIFVTSRFSARYTRGDAEHHADAVIMRSAAVVSVAGKTVKKIEFEATIENNAIAALQIAKKGKTSCARSVPLS